MKELIRSNNKGIYKRNQIITIVSCLIGCVIGLYPLWKLKFLLIIIGGILSIIFIIVLQVRYNYIVGLNIILLAISIIEPSPSDIVFILILLFGLINGELEIKRLREGVFPLGLVACFLFTNLLGMFNMIEPYHGMKYFIITLYLLVFAFFFFIYMKEERLIYTFRAYVISTVLSALLGFIGYLGYFSNILMYDEHRVQGLFKDPNVFGPFLIPGVLILIEDIKARKIFGNHLFLYFSTLGLIILGVIFSFSRGAWVNLVVSLFIYYLLNFKKYPIKKIIILLLIIILCGYFVWFYILSDELKGFFLGRSSLQGYDVDRFTAQRVGLSLASENIFGYGPGQYEWAVVKKMGMEFSAHNLYIRLVLENGIIGFLSFLILFLYIILRLFQLRLEGESKASLLISILVGIMVNSLVIDTIHWRHLWFFTGLSLSIVNKTKKHLV